jgi:uncharacterized protein (TIGR00730 family)
MTSVAQPRLAVFCGSGTGNDPLYAEVARETGLLLARRKMGLVYGGASIGIMGEIANAVLDHGGEVLGVIPERLMTREVAHNGLTRLYTTQSMHQRKALMMQLSDGFAALPGGFGTFDELFEIITWAQLGYHSKPVYILNVKGYFDPLIAMISKGVDEGFIRKHYLSLFHVFREPDAMLDAFGTHISGMAGAAGSGVSTG